MTIAAVQGQTWDMLSLMAYNNEFYVTELMLANPEYHGVTIFEGGELIEVPELEAGEDDTWS